MSVLSNIPPHAVLPLSAYDIDALAVGARQLDQRWLSADLTKSKSRAEVLAAIAAAFKFPAHFGMNLDALYDCITDLKPIASADRPGFVVVLRNLPNEKALDTETRDALLNVFRDAADYFFDKGVAFRLFYSVRR